MAEWQRGALGQPLLQPPPYLFHATSVSADVLACLPFWSGLGTAVQGKRKDAGTSWAPSPLGLYSVECGPSNRTTKCLCVTKGISCTDAYPACLLLVDLCVTKGISCTDANPACLLLVESRGPGDFAGCAGLLFWRS